MEARDSETISRLLQRLDVEEHAERARHDLLAAIYDDLHKLARARMRGQPLDHSLQATDLVNEVYVRLMKSDFRYESRKHLMGAAARAMRNILVDCARRRERRQHARRVPADDLLDILQQDNLDMLALERALVELSTKDKTIVRIVELRFFGDLTMQETASVLGRPIRSVERDWAFAKQWLKNTLK